MLMVYIFFWFFLSCVGYLFIIYSRTFWIIGCCVCFPHAGFAFVYVPDLRVNFSSYHGDIFLLSRGSFLYHGDLLFYHGDLFLITGIFFCITGIFFSYHGDLCLSRGLCVFIIVLSLSCFFFIMGSLSL